MSLTGLNFQHTSMQLGTGPLPQIASCKRDWWRALMHSTTSCIIVIILSTCFTSCITTNKQATENSPYRTLYRTRIQQFRQDQQTLLARIEVADCSTEKGKEELKQDIHHARLAMKRVDIWLRYLDPLAYKKVNAPLPVEWETEVFEKFEKPYKREGAGLSLAEMYLDEESVQRDSVRALVRAAYQASGTYLADSITREVSSHKHFFYANRLFLLNLAAIYTTGFECPDAGRVIIELDTMLSSMLELYAAYNATFTDYPLSRSYKEKFESTVRYVSKRDHDRDSFDHFHFIRDFVNPLYALNHEAIENYDLSSRNVNDYSLNSASTSIFDKRLYRAQHASGVFAGVEDEKVIAQIKSIGRLLFYDPILSGNNQRSCASCHNPTSFFTDTTRASAIAFDRIHNLSRNSPSLLNVMHNHLLMLDGKHLSLSDQAKAVLKSKEELSSTEKQILEKVLSVDEYKNALQRFVTYTPYNTRISLDHIISAITLYYSDFSYAQAPFDHAMNNQGTLSPRAITGFNLFMSKAQCGTCHFVPQFNGVKPPFVGSEFEVIGVPADTNFVRLSADSGRYLVHPAYEMKNAFRTGTIRNADRTKPYMHNGVFWTLDQVMSFYNAGGGQGRKLHVENQTLSADSLKLKDSEIRDLLQFISSLNEELNIEPAPARLPASSIPQLLFRKVGGDY